MQKPRRIVYFVSESTGITAESLGNSLLSQFPNVDFERHMVPFLNSDAKAHKLFDELLSVAAKSGQKPLVFATMPHESINRILSGAPCHYYELFERYVSEIGGAIGIAPTRRSGVSHGLKNPQSYDDRMDIVNYTLIHDDAMSLKNLESADVILLGVSRSGKTPTCLYLALHFGVRAANYPLTEDDFRRDDLPQRLKDQRHKLIGLTISPQRLAEIREKRRAGSDYATVNQCRIETRHALELFQRFDLPVLDTTTSSIEELSARVFQRVHEKGA